MSERPQQFIGFMFAIRDLERLIDLPRDHRIVKLEHSWDNRAPGLAVIVEGPGGHVVPPRCPVYYHDYRDWRDNAVDENREAALAEWGPYEW